MNMSTAIVVVLVIIGMWFIVNIYSVVDIVQETDDDRVKYEMHNCNDFLRHDMNDTFTKEVEINTDDICSVTDTKSMFAPSFIYMASKKHNKDDKDNDDRLCECWKITSRISNYNKLARDVPWVIVLIKTLF